MIIALRASEAPERSEGGRPKGGPPNGAEGSSERGEVSIVEVCVMLARCLSGPLRFRYVGYESAYLGRESAARSCAAQPTLSTIRLLES